MLRLFTSTYSETNPTRIEELRRCLQINIACDAITTIHVLREPSSRPLPINSKLKVRDINTRPRYIDFFDWSKELESNNSEIVVIANCDIYFDETLSVFAKALKDGQCAALARWDVLPDSDPVLFDRNDSQDVWIFRGPVKEINGDFSVGVPRCDNRLLHELKKAGYKVINPAFSIRSFHLHSGQREEYQSENLEHFVEPPHAYLWPHNLWSLPRTLLHNLLNPDTRVGWRFDKRKFEGLFLVRVARAMLKKLVSSSNQVNI